MGDNSLQYVSLNIFLQYSAITPIDGRLTQKSQDKYFSSIGEFRYFHILLIHTGYSGLLQALGAPASGAGLGGGSGSWGGGCWK